MATDRVYLEEAMKEAQLAFERHTYPVGAVIVNPEGKIISRGHNRVYSEGILTAHAEIEAIRRAGEQLLQEKHYAACTLYTTLEPCFMCCGAILHARIARVVWIKEDSNCGILRALQNKTYAFSTLYTHRLSQLECVQDPQADLYAKVTSMIQIWTCSTGEALYQWPAR